ncbi:flagellar filament outer layer protein FlaA [Candidatus Haliotispira prima]|uniref:Flagellar filament outer layer protein FlaA n=1 Tax=Candidatus Haliotispira prima TaxID=3034016 RepID=A0ABY8MEC3_9SPIO|nr:flagellar filament outer layer protein FlaA [Candidatus Haliotispira prima]
MKQAVSILFATAFFLVNGVSLWAEDPLYENVIVESFDGPSVSKFHKGATARILQEDGSTKIVDISGKDVIWRVDNSLASRYATEGFPTSRYVNSWPIDLFGIDPENAEELQALGVRAKFDRQGYNYFAVHVGTELDGEWSAQAMPLSPDNLPGRIKNINVWVWGAHYNYTIEMHVRDYQGVPHVLPMRVVSGVDRKKYRSGSLRFTGWRKMAAAVPNSVPQDSRYNLQDYRLQFVKFVVRTDPYERVDDFYIYFDQMQVIVDVYSNFYDGKNLARPDHIANVWGTDAAEGDDAQTSGGQ